METTTKDRYRILWPKEGYLVETVNRSIFRTKFTHIIAPVFNGWLECTLAWYYFNNETLVKTL